MSAQSPLAVEALYAAVAALVTPAFSVVSGSLICLASVGVSGRRAP
jgi:hypothetical protein